MKKLFTILSTIAISAVPLSAIISCGSSKTIYTSKDFQKFNVINDSKDISANVAQLITDHLNEYVDEYCEGQALKDIHLFDDSNFPFRNEGGSGDDEGDYIYESNEIIVNTYNIAKYTNFDDSDRANYLMQILGHEYNHYVCHSYLMNIDPSSPEADDSIYTGDATRVIQPWPKAFLETFKSLLNYNKSTSLYSDVEVSPGVKSLGSLYDAKTLFDNANGITDPSTLYSELENANYVGAPINPIVDVQSKRYIKDPYQLYYPYSMDELFARKMQIATSSYHGSTHFDKDGYYSLPSNFIDVKWESPYLEDVVKYQRGLYDSSNNGQYLADKPTQELANLYDEARGVGQTISYVENKNDKHVKSDGTFDGTIDRTKIRFGGTITDKNFLGYMDDDHFVNIPLNIELRNIQGDKDYLTDFVNATDIINKKLYLADDAKGTKKFAISSIRDSKYGLVSTRRPGETTQLNYAFNEDAILNLS